MCALLKKGSVWGKRREGGLPRRWRILAASVRTQIPSLGASVASHSLPYLSVRLWWLLLISLLSGAAKVICHLVQIRKRHPFLPVAGGGCAPRVDRNWYWVHSTFFRANILVQWTHKALCSAPGFALLRLIPLQGCKGYRYSRSRCCSPHSRWALGMWSSTWHVFIELLLSKPGPHGKLPASHLLFGHCHHQLCLLETRTLRSLSCIYWKLFCLQVLEISPCNYWIRSYSNKQTPHVVADTSTGASKTT